MLLWVGRYKGSATPDKAGSNCRRNFFFLKKPHTLRVYPWSTVSLCSLLLISLIDFPSPVAWESRRFTTERLQTFGNRGRYHLASAKSLELRAKGKQIFA